MLVEPTQTVCCIRPRPHGELWQSAEEELEALQASSVTIAAQAAVDRANGLPTVAQQVMGEAAPEVKAEWDPVQSTNRDMA